MTLSNQICFAIYNANRLFAKFYQLALARFQLTYLQYATLLVLWEKDDITLKELGRELNLESNTLTPLLRRLETGDWISRRRPASDKRQLVIRLTAYGRLRQTQVMRTVQECTAAQSLDAEQRLGYLQSVKLLNEKLADSIHRLQTVGNHPESDA